MRLVLSTVGLLLLSFSTFASPRLSGTYRCAYMREVPTTMTLEQVSSNEVSVRVDLAQATPWETIVESRTFWGSFKMTSATSAEGTFTKFKWSHKDLDILQDTKGGFEVGEDGTVYLIAPLYPLYKDNVVRGEYHTAFTCFKK